MTAVDEERLKKKIVEAFNAVADSRVRLVLVTKSGKEKTGAAGSSTDGLTRKRPSASKEEAEAKAESEEDVFLTEENADILTDAVSEIIAGDPDLAGNEMRITFNTRLKRPLVLLDFQSETINAALPVSAERAGIVRNIVVNA